MKTFVRFIVRSGLAMLLLLIAMMVGQQASSQTVVVYPPTSGNFVVPAGVTSIKVEVWGGGGGGGASGAILGSSAGGGGGGGAYNMATWTVSPGQTYTITIGAGGTVAGTSAGGTGGTTTVTGAAGTVTAVGGAGGQYAGNGNGAGGAGGAGLHNGGAGGTAAGNISGGGGGGAGNNANGGAGTTIVAGTGGTGSPNNSPYIGGVGGAPRSTSVAGAAGTAPGGGGSGGRCSGGLACGNTGGVGGQGQVVITYTACITPSAPTLPVSGQTCGQGTVTISVADPGAGIAIDWYANASGGSPLFSNSTSYTTGTISTTATFYAEARRITGGCVSTSRTAVVANVFAVPVATVGSGDISNISCFAAADGSITVHASGGTSPGNTPYTFTVEGGSPTPTWVAESSPNTKVFTGLLPNTPYRIKVKDNHGCTSR